MKKLDDLVTKATDLYRKHKFREAIIILKDARHAYPRAAQNNAEFHNVVGLCFEQLDRHNDAEHALRRALKLSPATSNYHYNLGLCLQMQNRNREACDCFNKALELNPEHEHAKTSLAQVEDAARTEAWTEGSYEIEFDPSTIREYKPPPPDEDEPTYG